MTIHLFWIINQSGQLIAKIGFTDASAIGELGARPDLQLTVSSVLFSTYGMSQELTPNADPIDSAGMHLIECEEHNIHIYETPTMLKLVLITDPRTTSCSAIFKDLHEAYVEYAAKNPFHLIDETGIGQPIRIPAFTAAARKVVERYQR